MTGYGLPYKGSKGKIAERIVSRLPSGKRFVDLFGGGFAMSHCAALSGKYESILYNDTDSLLVELIKDAIGGRYNYNNFKPEFITREAFEAKKDADAYVRYIWSFGNNGRGYMFGKDVEPTKHAAHDLIIFGKPSNLLRGAEKAVTSHNIRERRLQLKAWARARGKRLDIEQLERLERLERLQQFSFTCASYDQYEHREGDIVYCDPPYEGTDDYGSAFDSEAFYEWVRTRPFQVWFSSYQGIKGFRLVWAKQHRSTLCATNNCINYECLYTNR